MQCQKRKVSLAAFAGLAVSTANAQFAIVADQPGSFTDISGTGTLIATGDDDAGLVTVTAAVTNAAFPEGMLYASTNGHAGYAVDTSWNNAPLPDPGFYAGTAAAAVFWDDLITNAPGAGVYAQETAENGVPVLIIQWWKMDHQPSSPDQATFELKIFGGAGGPGGAYAQYIYSHPTFGDPTLDNGASATIGYQINATAAAAYSFNTASVPAGTVLSLVPGVAGACCLPDGTCQMLSSANCANSGGIYRGDNTPCAMANCPPNLVTNGGFETGDFTGWTLFGETGYSFISPASHHGAYSGEFGPIAANGGIRQTLAVAAGTPITIDFWYQAHGGINFFSADLDGTNLVSFTNDMDHPSWTHFSFNVTTAAADPTLSFTFYNPPSYDYVDDVRVVPSSGDPPCYANCDGGTAAPFLNINDFICFQTKFAAGDTYANCDHSTQAPVLNVNDFICFQTGFAAGCSAP